MIIINKEWTKLRIPDRFARLIITGAQVRIVSIQNLDAVSIKYRVVCLLRFETKLEKWNVVENNIIYLTMNPEEVYCVSNYTFKLHEHNPQKHPF